MEENNNNKNTILLTIIAVATLLVAVVGATFAYFTAQTSAEASANIKVETSTSDSFGYGTFGDLSILATQQNFGPENGSLKASTSGEVTLTANREQQAEYCYTATIKITDNPFVYTTQGVEEGSPEAELLLEIQKDNSVYSSTLGTLTYKTITGTQMVCDQTSSIQSPACQEEESINGYDITTFGNSEVNTAENPTEIKIPVEDGQLDGDLAYVHKITAAANTTQKNTWGITVTFVNLKEVDQQENTEKIFHATLEFKTVNCTTGNPEPTE